LTHRSIKQLAGGLWFVCQWIKEPGEVKGLWNLPRVMNNGLGDLVWQL